MDIKINLIFKEVKDSMKFNINGKVYLRVNMFNYEIIKFVNCILFL